jgi:hypothetical protein
VRLSSAVIQKVAFERSRVTTFSHSSAESKRFKALSSEWQMTHFVLKSSAPEAEPCAAAGEGRRNNAKRIHAKPRNDA